jgi:hypothetical protein
VNKWLILGLLIAIFQAIPKQADKPQPNQNDSKHLSEQPPKPVAAGTENPPTAGRSSTKEDGANSKPEQATWCEKIFEPVRANWPLIAVAVWGILVARSTLGAIKWQAEETAKATKAMQESIPLQTKAANAAFLNAQAVINSERPWLFMVTNKPEQDPLKTWVRFSVVNRGRTPAEVTFFSGDFTYSHPDSLKPSPTYALEGNEFAHKKYLVPDDPPLEVYDFACGAILQDDDRWKTMRRDGVRLFFFGHVLYRDLITREEHETRYCYWLSPAEWVGLIIGGPPEWNKHT